MAGSSSYVRRFLLEELDIRGALVRLDEVWQAMLRDRSYAPVVASLLALRHYQVAGSDPAPLPDWLYSTLHGFVWLAVISTVYSGLEYVVAAVRILSRQGS